MIFLKLRNIEYCRAEYSRKNNAIAKLVVGRPQPKHSPEGIRFYVYLLERAPRATEPHVSDLFEQNLLRIIDL